MERRGWHSAALYVGLLAAAFGVAVEASWTFGAEIDNYAYDFLFRSDEPKPWPAQSAILAIDERTLSSTPGGMHGIRKPLAKAMRLVAAASPKAVAVDLILADKSEDAAVDRDLAAAFRATPNLVLSTELLDDGWEYPLPEFRQAAAALGQVHALPSKDGVTRAIPVEGHSVDKVQQWALSLQAYQLFCGAPGIVQIPPDDLEIGRTTIPVSDSSHGRLMRVRFPSDMTAIPRVSLKELLDNPSLAASFTGKAVFLGVTAVSEVRDRLLTPVSNGRQTTGIEIWAASFETIARGLFITDVPNRSFWVLMFCLGLVAGAGASFRYLPGWWAYGGGGLIVAAAFVAPYLFFMRQIVFPFATPVAVAVLCTATAAAYYHLVVRRNLRVEQAARARYQQAMHFVTHEMRTPLSAIQGSSELISRYALTEEKRQQIAVLINSESKRLARMVEVFLNVERLSAGQMELKRENIPVKQLVETCVERTRPLADRKHIAILLEPIADNLQLTGDSELMEYACYNLLTNAVKYSPQRTEVQVSARHLDGHIRIAVKDQGIGMDRKEVKKIFQKFYRTRKAEESGEAGTGIGLSIVQQIVEQHAGKIDVTSQPGAGSCFTLVLPATVSATMPTAAERH